MKEKRMFSGLLAAVMLLGTVPYSVLADEVTPVSVTKSGNTISIGGSNVSAENIKLYDNKAKLLDFTAADEDNDGIYTVDISNLEQSPDERYVKVGDEYYSFYKPYEVSNDLATWKTLLMGNFKEGTSETGDTGKVTLTDGKLQEPETGGMQYVIVPEDEYKKYSTNKSTVTMRVKLGGDGYGARTPEIITHLSDVKRPNANVWGYSEWQLVGTGYAVCIEWGGVYVRSLKGSIDAVISTNANGEEQKKSSWDLFSKGYASNPQGKRLSMGKDVTYTNGDVYDITVATETIGKNVQITVTTQKVNEDGTLDTAHSATYVDENSVSTAGTVAINPWSRMSGSIVESVKVTNDGADVVTKCADITKISQKITSVTKDWDEISVAFDGEIGAFAKDAITVTNAQGTKEKVDVTISKNTAVVDLTNVEGSDEAYKLSVKTDDGVKEYNFNKAKAFFEDFDNSENVSIWDQEALSVGNYHENKKGFVDNQKQSELRDNALLIGDRRMYSFGAPTKIKSTSSNWVKFKTKVETDKTSGVWFDSPAVFVNITDDVHRGSASNDTNPPGWSGPFYTGYAIYKRNGDVKITRMDNSRPTDSSVNMTLVGTKEYLGPDNENQFELEVKTEMQDGKFVATAKLTNLDTGKSNTYKYEDENPVSKSGKTFISNEQLRNTTKPDAEGKNYVYVTVDDLMMTSTDNTVTYIKTKDDYMAEWAEKRVTETGRNEINFVTLGGSITQGGGWTEVVRNYFQDKMGKTVNLINAGIGGTGSSFATMRLYEDVISKQPDIVFMDHAVNDISQLNLTYGNVPKTATYVERIIRELKSLENPPMIFMVDFTTEDILKLDKRIDKNYEEAKAEFEKSGLVKDRFNNTVTKEEDLHIMKKAYDGTNPDTAGKSAYYASAIPEDYYNWVAEYYGIPNINIHDFWKNFVSLDPLTTETISDENREDYGNKGYDLTVDYNKMLEAYEEFATGTNYDDLKAKIGDKTDVTPILGDRVHCSPIGKKMYGDFMVNEFKNNASVSFEAQKMPEKPLLSSSYEKTGDIKDVVVTKEEIKNNKRFEISGLEVEDGTAAGTYLKNGVKLTAGENDGTLTFKFYGKSFGYYGSGNVTAQMDGSKYGGEYHTINPLVAKEHTFTLTVSKNSTYELYRIFADEESFNGLGSAKLGDNSFVTIDLTSYADARAYKSISREKDKNMAWQDSKLLKWQDRIYHTNTPSESMNYNYIEEDTFINGLTDGKYSTQNAIYDMSSVVNGTRFKALSNNGQKTVTTGNVKTDKVYALVAKSAKAGNDTVAKVILNYADGANSEVTSTLTESVKFDSIGQGANANQSASGVQAYECVFEADDTKELASVQIAKSGTEADIIVLGMSLKPAANEKLAVAFDEFTDKDGKAINESVSALMGKEIVYKAKVVNATAEDMQYNAIVALYNGDTLVKTEVTPATISTTGEVKANITLPTAGEDGSYTVKVLVWNSLGAMVPVMDATVIAQ